MKGILPQNALKRDCNGKCIERIEGHYLEVVVLLYRIGKLVQLFRGRSRISEKGIHMYKGVGLGARFVQFI